MSPSRSDSGPFSTSRFLVVGACALFGGWCAFMPVYPVHAAFAAFMAAAAMCAWVMSRGTLEGIEVERVHRPRVFEGERVAVALRLRQRAGMAQSLVIVEDQCLASLSVTHRHLLPLMSPQWEAQLHYTKEADRHRGVYLLGPTRLHAADPLGVFSRSVEADCVTTLTIYPRAAPLGGYRILGPRPPAGPTLETLGRIGHGEEIIGVRPYRPGDPISRIHWRTSARRRELHVIELDTHVQAEAALFLDLTRLSRFGVGAESTTEMAISCAVSVLSEAANLRHKISMAWVKEKLECFPAGVGLAHLHLMLDRLAVAQPGGEASFWGEVAPLAAALKPGSRAVFIAAATTVPVEAVGAIVRALVLRSVAVDVILLDESRLLRIWREQDPPRGMADEELEALSMELRQAGARVLPISRGEDAAALMPRALED